MPRFRFVDRPAAEPEWKAVHRAADRGISTIRGPFLDAVEGLRDSISVSDMEVLINQGGAAAVIGEIPWFEFEAALTNAFLPAFKLTQGRAMRSILGVLEDDLPVDEVVLTKQDVVARFDLVNPQAVQVAARQAAEAVQQVTASTRKAIREIIRRGQLGLLTVAQQAAKIRDLIGLTERQTASVLNFEAAQIKAGITGAELERRVARKFDQVLKRRAMTISRSETIRAANLGQQNLWRQAADQGLIDRDTAQKRWITTADDRTCPICRPMDGQLRPLEEPFVSPFNGASTLTPIIHASCRCSMALEVAA
jgi:SPP1 gp7 family putative phage head morphogenesis protein